MPVFADTNVIVYAQAANAEHTTRAVAILEAAPVISTQVVNETVAVLTSKHGFSLNDGHRVASWLLDACEVVPVGVDTVRAAVRLAARYRLSHWDALIIGAALLAGCDTLYTEDLQHGQVFDQRLTVINPFLREPVRR